MRSWYSISARLKLPSAYQASPMVSFARFVALSVEKAQNPSRTRRGRYLERRRNGEKNQSGELIDWPSIIDLSAKKRAGDN
jgi:hypothetical protein